MNHSNKLIRVLLADKQPIVIHALTNLLEGNDKLIVVGKTLIVDEIPDLLTVALPDLLITDLWFDTQFSSLPVIEMLRLRHPRLKIILFTAENSPEVVRWAHQAKIEGFVLKTSNLDEISLAIHHVSAGHIYYSSRLINSIFTSPQLDGPSLEQLTPKEQTVLRQYARGLMPKEFAADLNIKPSTAETHLRNIKQALGFRNTVELLRWAWQQGI